MFLDQFISVKPPKECNVFKIITTAFPEDMNEKLHTHYTSIYIPT
jgi:hypothetical protein